MVDAAPLDGGLAPMQEEDDFASKLGLDDDGPMATPKAKRARGISPPSRSSTWRNERKARRVMPKITAVTLERSGFEPWTVNLLLERDNMAPGMEVTANNFAKLFALVDHDLAHGAHHRQRLGANVTARPKPRGPSSARQYFIKNRWLTKIPLQDDAAAARPTVTLGKRFRTLKRRSSQDTTPSLRPRRLPNASSAAADAPHPLGDAMNVLQLDL